MKGNTVRPAATMEVIEEGAGWDGGDDGDSGARAVLNSRLGTAASAVQDGIRKVYHNNMLLDALIYTAFLCLLSWVVLGARDQPFMQYKRNSRPQESLAQIQRAWEEPFRNVSSPQEWFDFMDDTFLPLLFPLTWYSGKVCGQVCA
jgi:hypothetical protein